MRNRSEWCAPVLSGWGRDQCDRGRRNEESRGNCSHAIVNGEQRENNEQLLPVQQELLIRIPLDLLQYVTMWIKFPQTWRWLRIAIAADSNRVFVLELKSTPSHLHVIYQFIHDNSFNIYSDCDLNAQCSILIYYRKKRNLRGGGFHYALIVPFHYTKPLNC